MLSFHRLFSVFALLASLALLSSARPTHRGHSLRVRASSDDLVARFQTFRSDMSSVTQDLSKMSVTGENPKVQIKNIVSTLDTMSQYLAQISVKPTPEQEDVIADIVTDVTMMVNDASYQVGLKAEFKKWYALWTEEDVAMQSFYTKCASLSYSMFKAALVKAGSSACSRFHDLKMRLTVNMFRGMGVGY